MAGVKTEEKYTDEPNTSRPSLGSQIKDFGTKTHFFSKKKWEKVRFRAILRKLLCLFHISQIRKALNIGGVPSEAYIAPITCLCPQRKTQIHEKKCDNY